MGPDIVGTREGRQQLACRAGSRNPLKSPARDPSNKGFAGYRD